MISLSSLETILGEVKNELMQKNQVREETHESMRKATSLSKQAILLIHQKKYAEAEEFIESAKEKISSLQVLSKEYPEIVYGGMLARHFRNIQKRAYF